jgi:hypothetical protein
MLQFAKPALHAATLHVPAEHAEVPLAIEHTVPHAPQLFTLLCVFVSQPSPAMPLQFAKPALHIPTAHVPAAQTGAAFAVAHTVPHAPQLFTLLCVFVSQPFAAFPSQSAKPALHIPIVHVPAVHPGVAFGRLHTAPHAPQLFTLFCVLISQPSAAFMLQFAKPMLQLATPHTPIAHEPVAFAGAHAIPQPPQCARALCVSTSQPFAALPSQFAKPMLQLAIPHEPIAHEPVAFAGAHAIPQPPQCARALCVFVSQPLAALPSQLPKPALQLAIPHAPIAHEGVAFATVHALPHAPQLLVSDCRSTQVIIAPAPHTVRGAAQSTRHAPATQN